MPLAAYPSATSVAAGQTIGLHLAADRAEQVAIEIHRVGAGDRLVHAVRVRAAGPQPIPADGAQAGFGWPRTASIAVPPDWPSGLYRVRLQAASGAAVDACHFVVRARTPGATSRVLLVYPSTTDQAYNTAGGASLYEFNSPGRVPASRVSFDRPGGLGYTRELPFARWLDREGVATEACSNLDLHADPAILANYRLVVSMGHDEYWSLEMRDALEAFIAGGGNVAFFSGNVCWWQVRLEAGNRIMVCYKDAAADPLAGIDDTRITVNWADAPVCRPENTLTGVGWRRGAQVDGQGTGYVCRFPQHWVFDGTGLDDGDRFGGALIGYETDACDFVEVDGVPRATGRDGTPPSFVILATADYTGVGGPAPGYATMGVYRRGGTVFTAAATDWGLGLERDPVIATITRNVVTRLSGPRASGTWERIGEAADVVALAAHGGRLFAATRAGRLWQREACGQNLRWAAIGQAPRILALGANGYAKPTQPLTLYAVTDDDRLLSLDPAAGGGWTALDSATGSTAIAVDDDLGVLAVDPAGRLWSWDPAARWTARGPAGLGVRAMAGHYRSLVACSHELGLWRRDIGLRSGWAALGAAVRDLTALAVTEGAIYAAADGTLWRRDLVDGSA